jgi:ABC-type multidrug transport system ATPase subunit
MIFKPGRVTVVVGPSGSGKTTLLSLIAGLKGSIPENSKIDGKVLFNDVETPSEKVRKVVGFVFQDDVILETMTAKEAIDLSIELHVGGLNPDARKELLNRMIEVSQLQNAQNVIIGSPFFRGRTKKNCYLQWN